MTETINNKDYYKFMRWFQDNHPDLYVKYWTSIPIPENDEKLRITGKHIDPADYNTLVQIECDYYTSEQHIANK